MAESGWKTIGNVNYYDEIVEPKQEGIAAAQQGALEETLQNVKKTLWDVERHTESAQSRLEQNNQSGVAWHVKNQKTYLEAMRDMLGGIEEYSGSINEFASDIKSALTKESFLSRGITKVKEILDMVEFTLIDGEEIILIEIGDNVQIKIKK